MLYTQHNLNNNSNNNNNSKNIINKITQYNLNLGCYPEKRKDFTTRENGLQKIKKNENI
jgi:hypothetical protein